MAHSSSMRSVALISSMVSVQLLLVEWDLGRAFVGGAGEQRWSVLTFVTLQGNEFTLRPT